MIEIQENRAAKTVITMHDMKPLQVARKMIGGEIIMRTASTISFEVMDLSHPGEGGCWTTGNESFEVELLTEPLTITITND